MRQTLKRLLDLLVALMALVLLAPLVGLAALAVRLQMGSPVFFRQVRTGLGGRTFILAKLRSMREAIGPDGKPLSDEQRTTALGGILRRTKIDELPQFWSVLRGEISLVGPRPLLPEYLSIYTPTQARRHLVRPGLSGWAQVNGGVDVSWEEKMAMDVWYVDHWSPLLDLRILARTIRVIVQGERRNEGAIREALEYAEREAQGEQY